LQEVPHPVAAVLECEPMHTAGLPVGRWICLLQYSNLISERIFLAERQPSMLNTNTLLRSRKQSKHHRARCKHPQVFTGLGPLSGTLARWHRSLPPNGKSIFILPFRLQALPWAQFAEFSLPLFTRKSFSATESWFHRLQLLLLLLFPTPPVN
jgi:hypothetical protein